MSVTKKFFSNPVVLAAMLIAVAIICGCTETNYCGERVLTGNEKCRDGKILTVKVIFDANGGKGSAPEPMWAESGGTIVLPGKGSLSKAGYTFVGWSIYPDFFEMAMGGYFADDSEEDEAWKPAGAKFNVGTNDTLTLYAIWQDDDWMDKF